MTSKNGGFMQFFCRGQGGGMDCKTGLYIVYNPELLSYIKILSFFEIKKLLTNNTNYGKYVYKQEDFI